MRSRGNPNDLSCEELNGNASGAYSRKGIHLALINFFRGYAPNLAENSVEWTVQFSIGHLVWASEMPSTLDVNTKVYRIQLSKFKLFPSMVTKFWQLLERRGPILRKTDLALLINKSSFRSSNSQVLNSRPNCKKALTDGASSNISSAYSIMHIRTKHITQPTFRPSTPAMISLTYTAKR